MTGCLSILTICGLLVASSSHLKMHIQELEIGPLAARNTLQEAENYGFLPVTEGPLLGMREEENPVVGSLLSLSVYGKSLNPATHLPQNTHLLSQPSHWSIPTVISAACSPAVTSYR